MAGPPAEFAEWDGADSPEAALTIGFARAYCALTGEDRGPALREPRVVVVVLEQANPGTYCLTGPASRARTDRNSCSTSWSAARTGSALRPPPPPPGQMPWNRRFLLFADAVLITGPTASTGRRRAPGRRPSPGAGTLPGSDT